MTVKERYTGIQSTMKMLNLYGCHFLTLLSIAEEESGKSIDLIEAIKIAQSKKWIDSEFTVTVAGSLALLKLYTGKEWTREKVDVLPNNIRDEQYTEAIWYNPGTDFTHYRRRGFDTLDNSNTVANGYIKAFYIYTCKRG